MERHRKEIYNREYSRVGEGKAIVDFIIDSTTHSKTDEEIRYRVTKILYRAIISSSSVGTGKVTHPTQSVLYKFAKILKEVKNWDELQKRCKEVLKRADCHPRAMLEKYDLDWKLNFSVPPYKTKKQKREEKERAKIEKEAKLLEAKKRGEPFITKDEFFKDHDKKLEKTEEQAPEEEVTNDFEKTQTEESKKEPKEIIAESLVNLSQTTVLKELEKRLDKKSMASLNWSCGIILVTLICLTVFMTFVVVEKERTKQVEIQYSKK